MCLLVTVVTGLAWEAGFFQSTVFEGVLAGRPVYEGIQGCAVDPFQTDDPAFLDSPLSRHLDPQNRSTDYPYVFAFVLSTGRPSLFPLSLRC